MARHRISAGRDLRRCRDQLRLVLQRGGPGGPVPARRRGRGDQGHPERDGRVRLARLPARRRPGPALRLPGTRALRPGRRAPLQPGQAAARPVRESDRRAGGLGTRGVQLPVRQPWRAQRRGLRAVRAALGGGKPLLRLGRRPAAGDALPRECDLRGARARPDQDAPAGTGGRARDLPGHGPSRGDRAPPGAGGHGGGTDAGTAASRRRSSSRWSGRCTRPASR